AAGPWPRRSRAPLPSRSPPAAGSPSCPDLPSSHSMSALTSSPTPMSSGSLGHRARPRQPSSERRHPFSIGRPFRIGHLGTAQHLLLASTQLDPTRQWLERAGADPDRIARLLDERLTRAEPTGRPPALTPAAKRALLDGHQVSRSLGSTYIGPEHMLLAIAAN